ncbi:MAG: holo-ACP synthase [Bacillota bacterium]
MIAGIGVDLVEVSRLQDAPNRERLLARLFTAGEVQDCRGAQRWQSLAARLAAKEAVVKALGTGLRGMRWHDIEVVRDDLGRPQVRLAGGAARRAEALGVAEVLISLSHTRSHAVAQAVALRLDAASRREGSPS